MNILITGTSSGIGHGLAQEYLNRGHYVWGISRRPAPDLAENKNYQHQQLDLTTYSSVRHTIPEFISNASGLDLVILNAGVLGDIKRMDELDVKAMKQAMEINVWANKVLLDVLLQTITNIKQVVGISSKLSQYTSPGWGPYSVSKAALNMLMTVYAEEYPGTHFTAFGPGPIDSEIQETISEIQDTQKYPKIKDLQDMRKSGEMPNSVEAAPALIKAMGKTLEFDSGQFLDILDLQDKQV